MAPVVDTPAAPTTSIAPATPATPSAPSTPTSTPSTSQLIDAALDGMFGETSETPETPLASTPAEDSPDTPADDSKDSKDPKDSSPPPAPIDESADPAPGEKTLDLESTRGKRIYAGYKYAQSLGKSPEEGGLGYFPKADEIHEWRRQSQDLRSVIADIASGEPQRIETFFRDIVNDLPESADQTFLAIADVLPRFLSTSPKHYNRLATHIINAVIHQIDQESSSHPDPAIREWAKDFSPHLKWYASGRKPVNGQSGQPAQPATRHPAEIELEKLRAERAQFAKSELSSIEASLNSSIDSAADADLYSQIDSAFDHPNLKSLKTSQPTVYSSIRKQIFTEVNEAVAKLGAREFALQRESFLPRMRDPQACERFKTDVLSLYKRIATPQLNSLIGRYITESGVSAAQSADAKRTRAQATKAPEPRSTGAGVAKPANAPLVRAKGETSEAFRSRVLDLYMSEVG